MKEFVSVFQARIARQLLKKGHPIADIKPDKENTERTIFIFKNEIGLEELIFSIKKLSH